jgi:hypothetical protein
MVLAFAFDLFLMLGVTSHTWKWMFVVHVSCNGQSIVWVQKKWHIKIGPKYI